jgi:hypothetical protein
MSMTEYAKALVPLAAGVALCLVDKFVAGDSIPDAVWLTLLGVSPVVAGVPNRPRAG